MHKAHSSVVWITVLIYNNPHTAIIYALRPSATRLGCFCLCSLPPSALLTLLLPFTYLSLLYSPFLVFVSWAAKSRSCGQSLYDFLLSSRGNLSGWSPTFSPSCFFFLLFFFLLFFFLLEGVRSNLTPDPEGIPLFFFLLFKTFKINEYCVIFLFLIGHWFSIYYQATR